MPILEMMEAVHAPGNYFWLRNIRNEFDSTMVVITNTKVLVDQNICSRICLKKPRINFQFLTMFLLVLFYIMKHRGHVR